MDRDHRATSTRARGPATPANGTPVTWEEWRPPPPTAARSVPLPELLTIVVLTPAQAALVIADLLDATGPTPPTRVQAVVRSDGAVDVAESPSETSAASASASVAAPSAVPLPSLLDEVVRNARRLPAHPHRHHLVLLREVETQAGSVADPAQRAAALRQALVDVIGPDAVAKVRRELVALLDAFNGVAVSDFGSGLGSSVRINGHTVGFSAAVRSAPPPPHAPSRPRIGRRRNRTRRLVAGLAVLVLVLAAAGYLVARGPGSGLIDSLRGHPRTAGAQPPAASGHRAHKHATHTAVHRTRTVATLAPTSAGDVHGVVLQKTGACTAGAPCGVMVTVHLAPSSASRVIGWRVGVTRGCSRRVAWSPVTTVTAQPGWTHVYATSSVPLPKGGTPTLVAITSTPAHAQSQPVPATGTPLSC